MKITDVKTILANRYLFVEIHTDEGLVGIGESGGGFWMPLWGRWKR
ncbi:MAG: hypothetical protein ACMZI0_18030 [Symbiopectobacterium sp.]